MYSYVLKYNIEKYGFNAVSAYLLFNFLIYSSEPLGQNFNLDWYLGFKGFYFKWRVMLFSKGDKNELVLKTQSRSLKILFGNFNQTWLKALFAQVSDVVPGPVFTSFLVIEARNYIVFFFSCKRLHSFGYNGHLTVN